MGKKNHLVHGGLGALVMMSAFVLMPRIVPAQATIFGIDENFEELLGSLGTCDLALPPPPGGGCDGIAPDLIGWTQTPPTGWSVEFGTAHVHTNACPEWDGWVFVTNEFFQFAQQGRDQFDMPGIIAVADSDEMDDCKPSGEAPGGIQFDSSLVSPAVTIPANAVATLEYLMDWRFEESSIADVMMTIDGGAPQTLLSLDSSGFDPIPTDVRNTVQTHSIPVSSSPQTVQFTWRYWNTTNNWWFAVDNIQLSWLDVGGPPPVVPAVTPWGLIVMAMLMLGAGALTLGRRKLLI